MYFFKLFIRSLVFGAIGGLIALFLLEQILPVGMKPKTEKEIEQQLSNLDEIQESIGELQQFVSDQKSKLKRESEALAELKKERARLEPVLDTERKTVEAILDIHQQKYQRRVWKERAVGFVVGFISSLFASFLIIWINRKKISA